MEQEKDLSICQDTQKDLIYLFIGMGLIRILGKLGNLEMLELLLEKSNDMFSVNSDSIFLNIEQSFMRFPFTHDEIRREGLQFFFNILRHFPCGLRAFYAC